MFYFFGQVFFVDRDSELGAQTSSELQSKFGQENVKFAALDITDHVKFGGECHFLPFLKTSKV